MNNFSQIDFIRSNTVVTRTPLLPEIALHLATEITPLWEATEDSLKESNVPPPYWAFAWPGGQAVARLVLDRPELVAGKSVLDFAAGTGLVGIAAMMAGAARVQSCDIDRFALSAIALNAESNGVDVKAVSADLVDRPLPGIDVVLAGDVCYEKPMADRVTAWLRGIAATGTLVLLGDPGRAYVPLSGIERVAQYSVPTSLELEDREMRETVIWRLLPEA
ncbi:methyltransferase [Azospirillum brasilense]|uniref:Methyltransferase n=3 Tax=Azospirillum TaxID=191 RepID=A0A4D8QI95_AZOBR|nr:MULTISPECIES: 50S ribosomal protein L11 methyltransferase [Azospirillum]AIB11048.1 50S ribosomal protein L11 methyltransferase [Azospirillum argentinense]ALJ35858.1 nicotinamide N-methyase [Azospirillum brasilense]EZQ08002.1 50S ribosomal protein L11 methyltransferase [Azospirillum argentinense]MDW7552260.1 50S ribosomal protein L11 methyltransferase [Azospirillum brasilense]MDW7593809.1 50S ribosomal protein L11 methyltransferase [Azospirillum brasilense]